MVHKFLRGQLAHNGGTNFLGKIFRGQLAHNLGGGLKIFEKMDSILIQMRDVNG